MCDDHVARRKGVILGQGPSWGKCGRNLVEASEGIWDRAQGRDPARRNLCPGDWAAAWDAEGRQLKEAGVEGRGMRWGRCS